MGYLQNATEEHQVFDTDPPSTGPLILSVDQIVVMLGITRDWDMTWSEALCALLCQDVEVLTVPAYWAADETILGNDLIFDE